LFRVREGDYFHKVKQVPRGHQGGAKSKRSKSSFAAASGERERREGYLGEVHSQGRGALYSQSTKTKDEIEECAERGNKWDENESGEQMKR